MFDIGMGEIGLIAVVGLLVLGPERLTRRTHCRRAAAQGAQQLAERALRHRA
jgi:Sec-independent protein translocase protein TatA